MTKNNELIFIEADRIIGCKELSGELMFLIKFKDNNIAYMSAKQAKIKYPQVVIKFYEERIIWHLNGVMK
ncbi:hypothetical protein PVAND_004060 [Polypedilum vanderplanki]|uniref:Chromo shadow domain-containing protein n=1 Tax=Polypedilum vanderplanki TaxID=319348 RepID=A0A9J6BVW8_POLVA|nr:hypothetical protein PVAND_004060 [Polypedilum vanderplanki]